MATKAPTSNGVALALSSGAPFMVVPDSYQVAMSRLAQTRLVTRTA